MWRWQAPATLFPAFLFFDRTGLFLGRSGSCFPDGIMHYDVVIIGAGMSGLAAGIRLAYFQKRVLILEKHYAFGGLNTRFWK